MKPLGYDGKLFANLGMAAGFLDSAAPGPPKNPQAIERSGQPPIYVATQQGLRLITVSFIPEAGGDIETKRIALLAALQPHNPEERVFVARLNDGTELECLMAIGQYRTGDVNETFVDFYASDDRWFERLDTTLSQIASATSIALPLTNHGGATASPIYKVGYSVQRTTQTATVGWKWRRTVTVTNNGDRNWNKVRLTADLGDTAAWVTASEAQSDGDDVRVRFQGREIFRTLTNFNTKRSFVHFTGTIPAGTSATYEIVYGNSAATVPTTLSKRSGNLDSYAADDLGGYAGTATSGAVGSMTDSGAAWETNEWADGFVTFTSGTGSVRTRRILSNTATVLTLNRVVATAPAAGTTYVLWRSGIFADGGLVTARTANTVTDTAHTTKWAPDSIKGATVTFLSPSLAAPATMTVTSNTTDTMTFGSSFTTQPAVGDHYHVERYGILNYHVNFSNPGTANRSQRGLWRASKYSSAGPKIRYGDTVPGGWIPWLMVDNQDQFAQLRVTDETAGASVSNWPYLSARRRVRSDLPLEEKGQADGVAFYDPRGMVSLDWDYRMENDNGIGAVKVLAQEPGGDDWYEIASDSTTRATFVAVTSGGAAGGWSLTGDAVPVRLYIGVVPAGGVQSEIASTESKNRNAEVRNNTRMMVYLSTNDMGGLSNSVYAVSAAAAVYDLNVVGRLGGDNAGTATPPYDKVSIGGAGHYLHLSSGQKLWINPSPSAGAPLFGIYSGDTLVSRAPWAGVIKHHERNLDGTDTALVAREMLQLPPGSNLITTGEDNTTGWTIANSAGVTASISNGATVFDGGTTSLQITVTTTPAGAWTITLTRTANSGRIDVIPGTLYEFGFVRRRSTLTASITAEMKVEWSYNGGTVSTVDTLQTIGGAMAAADTWYAAGTGRKIHAGTVAVPATTEAKPSIVISGTGSTSGSVFIDPITLGVPNLYISEAEQGTLTLDVAWREAFHV